jgi:hypothetical protein
VGQTSWAVPRKEVEKFLFEVANPWIFCPQTQFEVARLPQKWEYPWVRCEGVISKYMRKRALEK